MRSRGRDYVPTRFGAPYVCAPIRTRNTVKKQDGKTVMVYTPLRMMKCREPG